MPKPSAARQVAQLTDRLQTYGRAANAAIDGVGSIGGFGIAGSLVGSVSPDLARKMKQIQGVYDTFGREATTGLLASHVAANAIKRLPKDLRRGIKGGARSVIKARPLLSKIIRLADSIARAVV